jgi:hypothetical protein
MICFPAAYIVSIFLDFIGLSRQPDRDTDVEILLLRQHLRMLQYKRPHQPRMSRYEQRAFVALACQLPGLRASAQTRRSQVVLPFRSDTRIEATPRACAAHMDLQAASAAWPDH